MTHPVPDTRTILLEAALECFAHCGFEGTSIRMIADRAARPLSLISHHFGGKEGLYVEVFRHLLTGFQERFLADIALQGRVPATREAAVESFRTLIRFLYLDSAIKRRNQDPLLECGSILWLREFRSPRPALQELIHNSLSPLVERLKACVTVICPGLDASQVRFLCISVLGMIHGHSMMFGLNEVVWGKEEACDDPDENADRLLTICLRGLEGYTEDALTPKA